jgi:hypothetical protein
VLSERRTVDQVDHALLLAPAPVALPETLSGVSFRELRNGDSTGELSWLWQRVDTGGT